ncbi:MAG TPA: TolC family protein [Candidatus Acidoferrum sp.]|nr:TolC family protein [Candidatus Acidoferrum sp.]
MNVKRMTAERSSIWACALRSALRAAAKRTGQLSRATLAAFLAVLLAGGPVWAQDRQPQQQQPAPAPARPGLPTRQTPAQDVYTPAPTNPPIPVSLGVSKYNYTRAPRAFPNLIAPYRPIRIPEPLLTNSPRVDQLIHDGKLELTLQDAVELALENSMDIAVQRYIPWFAETDILATEAGSQPQGITGAEIRQSFANIPFLNFDPTFTSQISYDDRKTPVNNPLISGTGATATAASLVSHTAQYANSVTQGFSTGTTATLAWNNTRSSSGSAFNFFNPDVSSALVVTLQQQLLNGFGRSVNRRNIMIAKNNRKLADYVFEQQAITTVTSTITAYWELVYARAAVEVQQQAVSVSQRLYGDNKKQLEIGTLAPLDVTRAEAQLATDQQNLIIAQTTKLQDEQILKNAISKDPLAANLINVEIIPIDKPTPPEATEAHSFEESIKEAFQKRPELLEQQINITNAGIDARATGIALRPTATLFAQYTSQGLAGVSPALGTPTTVAGAQIVDANGNPVAGFFEPLTSTPVTGKTEQGFTTAQSQIFHNQFPDYLVGVTVQIPIRNRAAQATNQRSILQMRQIEAQMQQLKNVAVVDVRNTFIALEQGRVQVATASEARKLQQQTFDAEQKKYQLGASTVYQVILTQRDLVSAQGAELRALANLLEAKAQYERAVGRTLDVNRVTIADAKHGEVEKDTLIPGTLHGKVVGTENLLNNGQQ